MRTVIWSILAVRRSMFSEFRRIPAKTRRAVSRPTRAMVSSSRSKRSWRASRRAPDCSRNSIALSTSISAVYAPKLVEQGGLRLRRRSGDKGARAGIEEVAAQVVVILEVVVHQSLDGAGAHLVAGDQGRVHVRPALAGAGDDLLAQQAVEDGEDGGIGQWASARGQPGVDVGHRGAFQRPQRRQTVELELRQLAAGARGHWPRPGRGLALSVFAAAPASARPAPAASQRSVRSSGRSSERLKAVHSALVGASCWSWVCMACILESMSSNWCRSRASGNMGSFGLPKAYWP